MIVAQVLELDTQAIDFVLAFPQAELEVPVYMELHAGMDLAGHGKESSKYLLKLKRSLYGLKQASMNWNCKFKTAFEDRGFAESLSDPCVFISKDMIILVYVYDCILISKEALVIQKFISSLKAGTEDFVFTEEGTMNLYLGVDIYLLSDKKGFTLSQTFLIDRVIQTLNFDPKTTKSAKKKYTSWIPTSEQR